MKSGKVQIFCGQLIKSNIIHEHPVPSTHLKFEVKEVISKKWEKFDKDLHFPGRYFTWPVNPTKETIKETKGKEKLKAKIHPKQKIKNKALQKIKFLRLVKKKMEMKQQIMN